MGQDFKVGLRRPRLEMDCSKRNGDRDRDEGSAERRKRERRRRQGKRRGEEDCIEAQ